MSYIDHINDDMPEVDSVSDGCYQPFSSPWFSRREPGNKARVHMHCKTCQLFVHQRKSI